MRKFVAAVGVTLFFLQSSLVSALDFSFSFSDDGTRGNIAGTVTGRILGLTDNSTGPATSVIIDTRPAVFSPLVEGSDATLWTLVGPNTFTVTGGVVTGYYFEAFTNVANDPYQHFRLVNSDPNLLPHAFLGQDFSGDNFIQSAEYTTATNNDRLVFPTIQPLNSQPIPEPPFYAALLAAFGLIAYRRYKFRK